MNKRTGWSRRWTQSWNPSLEPLEDRLVLSGGNGLDWHDVLSNTPEFGRLAEATPAIERAVSVGESALSKVLDAKDSGATYHAHDSLSTATMEHALLDIERLIIKWSPAPTALDISDVQTAASYALQLFSPTGKTPSADSYGTAPTERPSTSHASLPPEAKEVSTPPQGKPAAEPSSPASDAPVAAPAAKEVATAEAAKPAEKVAAPEHANPGVDVAERMAASAEGARNPAPAPPSPPAEDGQRQAASFAPGRDTANSYLSAGSFAGSAPLHEVHADAHPPTPTELASESGQGEALLRVPTMLEHAGPSQESDGSSPMPAPLAADLILEYVPFNVANFRSALDNFLTEIQEFWLGGNGRGGLGLSLLLATLAASGIAGHAIYEKMRRRHGPGDSAEDDPATWFHPCPGLPEPEIP